MSERPKIVVDEEALIAATTVEEALAAVDNGELLMSTDNHGADA